MAKVTNAQIGPIAVVEIALQITTIIKVAFLDQEDIACMLIAMASARIRDTIGRL